MSNVDIPRLEALHAEATRFYASGRIELTHDDETARRWAVVAFEAFPDLLAEVKELRAERDRLHAEAVAEGAVRTKLRAELADRDATIAGLLEAANLALGGGLSKETWQRVYAALARTPAQHLARIEAGVLREAAVRLRKQDCSDEAVRTYEWLTDEADRLERGE